MPNIEDAADELYSHTPKQFIAARNKYVSELKLAGNKDAAAEVAAFPRPSLGAWVIGQFARDHMDVLIGLQDLGGRYRAAEQRRDRNALTALNEERRSSIAELLELARDMAEQKHQALNRAALDEIRQTALAGIADEAAARAMRSGRLVAGLTADGIDAVDLEGATVGRSPARPARSRQEPHRSSRPDETAARMRTAKNAVAEARKKQTAADVHLKDLSDRAAELDQKKTALASDIEEVKARLETLRSRRTELDRESTEAKTDVLQAARIVDECREAYEQAERDIAQLRQ